MLGVRSPMAPALPGLRALLVHLARSVGALLLACGVASAASVLQVQGEDGHSGIGSPLVALDSDAQDLLLRARSPQLVLTGGQARDPRDVLTLVAIDERT